MRNIKCIIGASILTPICLIIICLIIIIICLIIAGTPFVVDWISIHAPIVFWSFGIIIICLLGICIWGALFEHCIKFWNTRKKNKSVQHH